MLSRVKGKCTNHR